VGGGFPGSTKVLQKRTQTKKYSLHAISHLEGKVVKRASRKDQNIDSKRILLSGRRISKNS